MLLIPSFSLTVMTRPDVARSRRLALAAARRSPGPMPPPAEPRGSAQAGVMGTMTAGERDATALDAEERSRAEW